MQIFNVAPIDVTSALESGNPHDSFNIAYHLILDNKRMVLHGKKTGKKDGLHSFLSRTPHGVETGRHSADAVVVRSSLSSPSRIYGEIDVFSCVARHRYV